MKTYPLLQSQLGIFLEWIQTPSMTKYNLPTLTPFPKSITVDKIESMLRDIIDARPELRTRFVLDENGNPIKGIPRHPIVEDDVIIYSNATLLGRITIGDRSIIGANRWVTENIAPDSKIYKNVRILKGFEDGYGIRRVGCTFRYGSCPCGGSEHP